MSHKRLVCSYVSLFIALLHSILVLLVSADSDKSGKTLNLELTKEAGMEWWTKLADGEEALDTTKVRKGREGRGRKRELFYVVCIHCIPALLFFVLMRGWA